MYAARTPTRACALQFRPRPSSGCCAGGIRSRTSELPSQVRVKSAANYLSTDEKRQLVQRVIAAKERAGTTFDEIAAKLGVTNVYAAQLLHNQVHLASFCGYARCQSVKFEVNDHSAQ
jgi:hypothetical protein